MKLRTANRKRRVRLIRDARCVTVGEYVVDQVCCRAALHPDGFIAGVFADGNTFYVRPPAVTWRRDWSRARFVYIA